MKKLPSLVLKMISLMRSCSKMKTQQLVLFRSLLLSIFGRSPPRNRLMILVTPHPLRNPNKKKMLKRTSHPLPKLPWKVIKVIRLKLNQSMTPSPLIHMMMQSMIMITSLKALPRTQDLRVKILQILLPY